MLPFGFKNKFPLVNISFINVYLLMEFVMSVNGELHLQNY